MPAPRLAVLAVACAAALAVPATAAAVPPANDNYLLSTVVTNDRQTLVLPSQWTDREPPNTAEATTQTDLFNPFDENGTPGSGGGPEPLTCSGTTFSKTVWYDLHPPTFGGVELMPSGFDMAVAVYEYNRDSRITSQVLCQNDEATTTEDVLFDVKKGRQYTVQIGGVNGAAGQLALKVLYFRDSDNDQTLNAFDECPGIRGTRSDGCPPTLNGLPRYGTAGANPLRLTKLSVENVVKGARVEASCGRCGRKFVKTARKSGTVRIKSFIGRSLPAGDKLVIRVTHRATGKGKYRFGAIGRYFSYEVLSDTIGKRTARCLNPGSRKPVRCGD
jgi:hypothetical protein